MPSTDHSVIRDDLSLPTWLLLGATLQSLIFAMLPPRIAWLPAGLLLTVRVVKTLLSLVGLVPDQSRDKVVWGRNTVRFPQDLRSPAEDETSNDQGLAVFVLGARFNHPLSRLAPGVKSAKDHFDAIWKEAEEHRHENGYLGRAADLMGTDSVSANAIVTISYWRSKRHLYDFARTPAHLAGWQWFEAASKRHPHLSFFHETYAVPADGWECVYRNAVPWGLAQSLYPVSKSDDDNDDDDDTAIPTTTTPMAARSRTLRSPIVPAVGASWKKVGTTMKLV